MNRKELINDLIATVCFSQENTSQTLKVIAVFSDGKPTEKLIAAVKCWRESKKGNR